MKSPFALLAQETPVAGWNWMLLGVFVAVLAIGALSVSGLALLLMHLRASRKLLHTERMRALEAGFPLEVPDTTVVQQKILHNAFWIAFWLVFGVPSAAFSAAAAAMREIKQGVALGFVIWIAAALASVAAVVCATVLMINARSQSELAAGPTEKPRPPKPTP